MAHEKRASKHNIQNQIEPHEPQRLKSLSRLWIHPQWDQRLFSKGQVWIGVRMEGSTILGDCFDCKIVPPPDNVPTCSATINGSTSTFACRSGFRILSLTANTLELSYNQIPEVDSRATFYAPSKVYDKIFTKSVTCVDANGEMGVAASLEKAVKVWNLETEEIKCDLQDQGETNVARWLLSASQPTIAYSADSGSIKIFNVAKRKTVRTFKAHSGRIQEMIIADRHLFSASQDGKIRRIDINRSDGVENIAVNPGFGINCMDVQNADTSIKDAFDTLSPSSGGQKEGKVVIYGGDDSTLRIVALNSRKVLFSQAVEDTIQCCALLTHPYFACGLDNGQLYYFDWRKPDAPLCHWRELRGGITCMVGYKGGIICGTADGSCFHRNPVLYKNNETALEFCGGDYEPILKMCHNGEELFSSCRDCKVRRYKLI